MPAVAASPFTKMLSGVAFPAQLGVEFDSLGIAAARMKKTRGGWTFAHRTLLPTTSDPAHMDTDAGDAVLESLFAVHEPELGPLRRQASSQRTSCALPMEFCSLAMLELPEAPAEELDQMVEFEVCAESDSVPDVVFDYWKLPDFESASNSLNRFASISADDGVVRGTAEFMQNHGISLSSIDCLPTAAARAITLTHSGRQLAQSVSMAVHIGSRRTTLIIASNGCPLFIRVLSIGTYLELLTAISARLDIPVSAVRRILTELPRQQTARLSRSLAERLLHMIRDWSDPMCEEILRSVAFVGRPGMRCVPKQLILMGPGSGVCGLPGVIEYQTNIRTSLWSPGPPNPFSPVSEFAIPAALSVTEVAP